MGKRPPTMSWYYDCSGVDADAAEVLEGFGEVSAHLVAQGVNEKVGGPPPRVELGRDARVKRCALLSGVFGRPALGLDARLKSRLHRIHQFAIARAARVHQAVDLIVLSALRGGLFEEPLGTI